MVGGDGWNFKEVAANDLWFSSALYCSTIYLLFILAIMLSSTVESTHWKNIGILVKLLN
jgi:hypothetical protein